MANKSLKFGKKKKKNYYRGYTIFFEIEKRKEKEKEKENLNEALLELAKQQHLQEHK